MLQAALATPAAPATPATPVTAKHLFYICIATRNRLIAIPPLPCIEETRLGNGQCRAHCASGPCIASCPFQNSNNVVHWSLQ